MSAPTYGVPAGGATTQVAELIGETFALSASDSTEFVKVGGADQLRAISAGGEVLAGLMLVPMGQYWGGRRLSMTAYSAVATAAHARGSGVATQLMRQSLVELRAQGVLLSALYPATQPLYRRVGFEQAGVRCEVSGPVESLPDGDRTLRMRPFRPEDLPAVKALYESQVSHRPGWLSRGDYVWHRVLRPRGQTVLGYVVEAAGGAGALEGYVFLSRKVRPDMFFELTLSDWMARSPQGWRRLLGFLKDHGSLACSVAWYGGLDEALLLSEREQRFEKRVVDTWMLRLLDVPGALGARGYARALSGELHLDVGDPLFPENAGRWILTVDRGAASVRAGGSGHLRCDVKLLASLFAGHHSASELVRLGLVEASEEARELADALFAGPAPSLRDRF